MDFNAFNRSLNIHRSNQGRLKGVTVAIKDVFSIKGLIAGAGNPDWERTHEPAQKNAEVVEQLLEEGVTITGTTHTDELMFSLNGENYHYGTPVNPTAQERVPGGSSSGSAVAVSAGLVDVGIGTDTGGSVRIPSSYCGIYGFRPTHGAVSTEGLIPLASQFDTVGWMTKSSELLYDVGLTLINQPDYKTSFTKLIVPEDIVSLANDECTETFTKHLDGMKGNFDKVITTTLATEGIETWFNTFRTLQGYEVWQTHGDWIKETNPKFGPDIEDRFNWASTIKEEDVEKARLKRAQIQNRVQELIDQDSIVLMPTAPGVAPYLNGRGEVLENQRKRMLLMTCISGLLGYPQLSLPVMHINGIPVGISMIAAKNQDLKLLHLANELASDKKKLSVLGG
ncbi:amidase [Evansella cellulosilytica]|uniref:Amidase n=1 Tax=Evansella cellulosilytica (strain ATCC 21833 / DSM 2522 / FERM P-1141 / JCM 9156 / N-4) TaxID=649639 RepID=E6TRY2_EVAC2|nr:amidase [Evansella cellulosilytica]ADU29505.1 Amidase [Evansella cellulosilytica DSM 2522]